MSLSGPKKQPDGSYLLSVNPPVSAPSLRWNNNEWIPTEDWITWADSTRANVIGQLLNKPAWFSRAPRRNTIETLCTPWGGRRLNGELFLADAKWHGEDAVGNGHALTATWNLSGLRMTSQNITPVWTLDNIIPDPDDDKISLFGSDTETVDGITIDGGDDTKGNDDHKGNKDTSDDVREIALDDISPAAITAPPTQIRSREWEGRKFLAKERVREARLKAQIADRVARREEERFYTQFGDLDDSESHFSEYDLTDEEESAESVASETN